MLNAYGGIRTSGGYGILGIWVTNTGTAATTKSHPIVVTLGTGRGILVAQGGKGTDWQRHKQDRDTTCTRAAPLGAGQRTMITVTVWVNARAGKTRRATATVSPSDKTPPDNTSTDKAIVRKHLIITARRRPSPGRGGAASCCHGLWQVPACHVIRQVPVRNRHWAAPVVARPNARLPA